MSKYLMMRYEALRPLVKVIDQETGHLVRTVWKANFDWTTAWIDLYLCFHIGTHLFLPVAGEKCPVATKWQHVFKIAH